MPPLSDLSLRNARFSDKAYKLVDGQGLYLLVEPSGSKLWRWKYRFQNKEKKLALGRYPEVSLAAARDRAIDARRLLASGVDPGEKRRQEKRAAKGAAVNTFEVIARDWFKTFSSVWAKSHSDKVILRLENDLFPWLGRRPITEIEADTLLEVVRRIESRGALDTAHRCLSYCGQIFRFAIATARARRNPAADLRGALRPVQVKHFASITDPDGIGELMRSIYAYHGNIITACAQKLLALTIVRPKNVRYADPKHFNLETAEWRIPAEQMKMKQDLIVPLSRQAVEVVREIWPMTGSGRYLFPCQRTRERPISENTLNSALRRMGYSNDEMTAHGYRAMARTVLDEVLEFRVDWIEHQLAHAVRDPNGRAYNRTAFLEGRRVMMQRWADYLDERRLTNPSISTGKAA